MSRVASTFSCRQYFSFEAVPGSIAALDGLRGIAILLVLFRHGVRPFYDSREAAIGGFGWDLMTPMVNGWAGVDLFFVLSGFLVSHHILKRWSAEFRFGELRDYLVKRILRIVPAYYAWLFVVAGGLLPFYRVPASVVREQLWVHLLFLQDYVPSRIVVAFWSLGVEEKFYLSIPLLIVPVARMKSPARRAALIALMTLVPLGLRALTYARHGAFEGYEDCFWTMRSPFHLALDSLLVGSLCAFLVRDRQAFGWLNRPETPRRLLLAGTALVAALIGFKPLLNEINGFSSTLLFSLLAWGFGAVLLGLVLEPKRERPLLGSRAMLVLSKLSYSLYLVHMCFIGVTLSAVRTLPGFDNLPRGLQFLIYFPVFAVVSMLAAMALHFAVEKPFLVIKDSYGAALPRRAKVGV
ncbi:MAG: acyltransferase [Planctomycetia bacterium]|nr:acyltransferase [Planctomycetia bacterium]